MTITLDSTKISTVVRCTDCPWWAAFADSALEGRRVGAAHEQRAHRQNEQARDALRKMETRRAER